MKDQIGIGFAGPGWIGSVQLRKLAARQDVRIVALHGTNQERCRPLMHELGMHQESFEADYGSMIARPDVDAICIASPNAYHGVQAIAALQAGKHVFCEKPATIAYSEHLTLQRLSAETPQLRSFVDYVLYFNPLERRLREMIASRLLGSLTQMQINYRHPINISEGRVWKLSKAVMGDAISMGINHALSVMYWLFEADGQYPVSVFATSDKARVRLFEADPLWNILVTFSGGGTGFCFGNIDFNNGYDAYHNVSGTEGAFVFDATQPTAQKVRYWSRRHASGEWIWPLDLARCAKQNFQAFAWDPAPSMPDSGDVLDHGLNDAIASFLQSVHSGTESPLSFRKTAGIADIGWAAQISAWTGERVSLPLSAEHREVLLTKE
jgi:predicted dehydrogenase